MTTDRQGVIRYRGRRSSAQTSRGPGSFRGEALLLELLRGAPHQVGNHFLNGLWMLRLADARPNQPVPGDAENQRLDGEHRRVGDVTAGRYASPSVPVISPQGSVRRARPRLRRVRPFAARGTRDEGRSRPRARRARKRAAPCRPVAAPLSERCGRRRRLARPGRRAPGPALPRWRHAATRRR